MKDHPIDQKEKKGACQVNEKVRGGFVEQYLGNHSVYFTFTMG